MNEARQKRFVEYKAFVLWLKAQGMLAGNLTEQMIDDMVHYYVNKEEGERGD